LIRFAVQTNPVIKLADIHKVYHTGEVDVHAVRGISLEVFPGEFVALMGASGSGKSTLMNMIGALDRPTGGNYLLDGIDVSTLDRDALADVRNEKIGFVFQGFNLLSRTSALENVEMPMLYNRHRIPSHEQRDRAMHALELVGLGPRADHHPNQLSGGQQQRVAIARALVNQPSLLLADEPTGNLDSQTSIEIMGVFQKLNDQGITIVMVTHELDVARFTKRMVILRDGKIVTTRRCRTARLRKRNCCSFARRNRPSNCVMRIFASLRIAGRALRRNKMRSLLTMLGIIIGVGAVIGSVSLTSGATKQVEDQVSSLGENVITVFSGNFTSGGDARRLGQRADADGGRRAGDCRVAACLAVSPEVRDRAQILANGLNWNTQVMGESPDYPQIRNRSIASGTMFTDQDVRSLAKSAVIGKTVADQLFPGENPLGQTCASATSRFRSSACSPRKALICSARIRMTRSSFPIPATCTASPPARL
jgi:ABC-type lipoprotein export system ATPase subunit